MGKDTSATSKSHIENSDLINRLDAIIRLLMANVSLNEQFSIGRIYYMLETSGLSTTEIGKIVGKPPKDISSAINKIKKKPSKEIDSKE